MEGMNQVLGTISQDLPWFEKTPNSDHIHATLVSPIPVQTRVHKTLQLSSQWTRYITTPLVNNQCNIQYIQSSSTTKESHRHDSSISR